MATKPMLITYAMWRLFLDCRKACHWRYFEELVPLDGIRPLAFGSTIHDGLARWHHCQDLGTVLAHIDGTYPERARDASQKKDWHLATAMMRAYAAHYAAEPFEVLGLEIPFHGAITNPRTQRASRLFTLAGRIDGLVRMDGRVFIIEHKTTAQIDASYLERLWSDFQILLYATYARETLGIQVDGVIFNLLTKAKLKQHAGETEEAFQVRKADLIAKSKSGKSTAKRRLPESDEAFQARLAAKYAEPLMFHRETLYLTEDDIHRLRTQLWELTQALRDARRRDAFYQNPTHCFLYGRPCGYLPLCRSGGAPHLIDNLYQHQPPTQVRDNPVETPPAF